MLGMDLIFDEEPFRTSISDEEYFIIDSKLNVIRHKSMETEGYKNITPIEVAQFNHANSAQSQTFINKLREAISKLSQGQKNSRFSYTRNGEARGLIVQELRNFSLTSYYLDSEVESTNQSMYLGVGMSEYLLSGNVRSFTNHLETDIIIQFSIFTFVNIIILILISLCSTRISRIVKPIKDLAEAVDNLLHHREVSTKIQNASRQVAQLYDAIFQIKTTINVTNQAFNTENQSVALLDYAKAYTVFEKVKNVRFMGVIMNNIGVLHFRSRRYAMAASAFQESIDLFKQSRDQETTRNAAILYGIRMYQKGLSLYYLSRQTSEKAWDKALRSLFVSTKMFGQVKHFEDYMIMIQVSFNLEQILISSIYLHIDNVLLAQNEIFIAEKIFQQLMTRQQECDPQMRMGLAGVSKALLFERILKHKADQFKHIGKWNAAATAYSESLTKCEVFDPLYRLDTLRKLQEIFQDCGVKEKEMTNLRGMMSRFQFRNKDIVFVLNVSNHMERKKRLKKAQLVLQMIFDKLAHSNDRLSLITFAKNTSKKFTLVEKAKNTTQLRNQLSILETNKTTSTASLHKGIREAILQLRQNCLFSNSQWIFILTNSKDFSDSNLSQEEIKRTLQSLTHIGVIVCGIELSHKHHREGLKELAFLNIGGTYLENPQFDELRLLFDSISNIRLDSPQMIVERIKNESSPLS